SHDLRTPLASIRAAAGSLLQDEIEWDPETRREFAAAIDEEAARLNRLVGNLLDLSRVEGGALHPRKELYPLDALIRAAVERLAGHLAGRRLDIDLPPDLPPVPLDPVQIDQVLTNLLENAIKYTPDGAPIAVMAAVDGGGDAVIVSVADRGPGIPPAERAQVFDKFYRLRGNAHAAGTGLGLAIARRLVEAHGGRIWVDDHPGGGARFNLSLPLSAEAYGMNAPAWGDGAALDRPGVVAAGTVAARGAGPSRDA
ncbi:MAG: Osmosensitive K+ channel histidine kinase KdpD, partial [uncultured Thermomicrobiales bacterium]